MCILIQAFLLLSGCETESVSRSAAVDNVSIMDEKPSRCAVIKCPESSLLDVNVFFKSTIAAGRSSDSGLVEDVGGTVVRGVGVVR